MNYLRDIEVEVPQKLLKTSFWQAPRGSWFGGSVGVFWHMINRRFVSKADN